MEPYGFGNHGFPTDLDMVGAIQMDPVQRIGQQRFRVADLATDRTLSITETTGSNGSGSHGFGLRIGDPIAHLPTRKTDRGYGPIAPSPAGQAAGSNGSIWKHWIRATDLCPERSNGTQRIGKQRIGASDFGHSFG